MHGGVCRCGTEDGSYRPRMVKLDEGVERFINIVKEGSGGDM